MEVKTMEVKKAHPNVSVQPKTAGAFSQQVWDFFGDVKSEIKKITWTSPEELKTYTQIVVIATFLFGMGIFGIDLMIQGTLALLSSTVKLIVG